VFEWVDFLDLAEELAARPNDEASARTAVSRAYYATFHIGRDFLVRAEIPRDRGRNAHVQVQRELRKQSARIGQDLELLHFCRKQADYDTSQFTDVNEQARSAATLARETIDAIKTLS
jgi:uncharacterized protein (UPF0332 family)